LDFIGIKKILPSVKHDGGSLIRGCFAASGTESVECIFKSEAYCIILKQDVPLSVKNLN